MVKPEENTVETVKGIVTAKLCDCCGHHEIGITTEDGRFISLKPGMSVELIRASEKIP